MGYIFLVFTILTESAAIIFMKLSDGFRNKAYGLLAVVCYSACFVFLTFALKQLPAGIANAIWAGASTLLVAVLGYFFFQEKLNWLQVWCMVLIVVGLVGLNVQGK